MNKPTIFLILILTIVSCKKKAELPINKNQFQNKTFSLISKSEIDTLVIEFQDSTHQIFGTLWEGKIPWRIYHNENNTFLELGYRVIEIEKSDSNKFSCNYIGLNGNHFILEERKPKWNKEQIYGTWIKKEDAWKLDYNLNDSISKPPLPPTPDGISEMDFKSPSYYEITTDSIKYYEYYLVQKSNLEISNTNEYLLMELENNYDRENNWQWNIKSLSNKEMIVQRKVFDMTTMKYKIDTLIRKKR